MKHIQTGFSFGHLGHAPGVGLGGYRGRQCPKQNIPKFNQFWCESYLHKWHIQQLTIFGPSPMGPLGGTK